MMVAAVAAMAACAGRDTVVTPPRSAPNEPATAPRLLVIALDAVPFRIMAAAVDAEDDEDALFAGLHGPVGLISTFPSSTSLAMTGILEPFGLAPALGYEARFFDREQDRVRGGGIFSYNKLKFSWRTFWSWHVGSVRKLTAGLRPVKASIGAIDDALEAFMASDQPVFVAYIDATDLVAHLDGPEALGPVLHHLDEALAELRRRRPERPFYTTLFSDHGIDGGPALGNVRPALRRTLTAAGYRLRKHLRQPKDVVLVPFGLIGSIVAYTAEGGGLDVASTIAAVEGIDFCVAPDGPARGSPGDHSAWQIAGARGVARIERRVVLGGIEWRYQVQDGDPLGFAALVPDADQWRGDRRWFESTRDGDYPDAFHRIARGFDLVTNRASVICSLAPDWMYGAWRTNTASKMTVGRLHWTHGAMLRASSLGFVMSDLPGWQPDGPLRFDQALLPFAGYASR